MRTCKKCNDQIPSWVIVEGKGRSLSKRSYCLKCSPFLENKGYALRKEKLRGVDYKFCTTCSRKFPWNKNNVCSTCRVHNLRWKNKVRACALLGGKCRDCQTDDIEVLTFHHTDPEHKKFKISEKLSCSWKEINAELLKCELLCFNCHVKHHIKTSTSSILKQGKADNGGC